ncbi:hypothetical protein L227DRAFT_370340 [Lentinus tigrinus ALCF2SS1-6]|uniref:Uncharacterized protein n=1 Tax=Lentinus tigrinus ALCF2SS1-6 TaxID=1328759 RepID=A0A5C2RTX6_9APHY|nr:hypothetical protein L227DRAFT_370340 [Lentinus tigrinus ALCF2SS1-6]
MAASPAFSAGIHLFCGTASAIGQPMEASDIGRIVRSSVSEAGSEGVESNSRSLRRGRGYLMSCRVTHASVTCTSPVGMRKLASVPSVPARRAHTSSAARPWCAGPQLYGPKRCFIHKLNLSKQSPLKASSSRMQGFSDDAMQRCCGQVRDMRNVAYGSARLGPCTGPVACIIRSSRP